MTEFDESARNQPLERVSDRGLRAFAAAATAGSLTSAANTLGMGQPAVSHAVRRLESALGAELLVRSRTGVAPTTVGAELLGALRPAFSAIDAAIDHVRDIRSDPTVSLLVSTSLATWWLLPRLPEFKQRYPDVPLRLVTTDTDSGVDLSTLDLWIPLGVVDRPPDETTTFCTEALLPVASPELAAELGIDADRAVDPELLLGLPLLHLEERYARRFDWARWFEQHGVDDPRSAAGDRSTDYSLVLHAALDGQGIALGWAHLARDLIDDGRLVALGDAVETDQPFVIVSGERPPSAGADALRSWLVEAMTSSSGWAGRLVR